MTVDLKEETTSSDKDESLAVGKSKRGLSTYKANPFIAGAAMNTKIGSKRIVSKSGDKMMIVSEHGEIMAPAGFHQVVEVDKSQFVKLFINGVKALQQLTSAGTQVFELIYHSVQQQFGKDELYINYASINQEITPMSESTYMRGMKELLKKGFIAQSMRPSMYYLNIDYLFSGDRLAFIKEYRLAGTNRKPQAKHVEVTEEAPTRDPKTADMFGDEVGQA